MTRGRRLASGAMALAAGLVVASTSVPSGAATGGTWVRAPNMGIARRGASVTLLGGPRCQAATVPAWCGKVLVSGGGIVSGGPYDRSSEIYDPVGGTWSAAGEMLVPRWGHRAVQLPDGRVLVMNGITETATSHGSSNLFSAELYDPDAGTWRAAGALAQARGTSMVAALISGPATSCGANCGKVLVAGGQLTGQVNASNTAEIYEPALDRWRPTAPMSLGRVNAAIVPMATGDPSVCGSTCGNLLAVGGDPLAPAGNPSSLSAELFDPAAESWRPTGPLSAQITTGAAAQLGNGFVVAIDRKPDVGSAYSAQVLDPVSTTWSTTTRTLKAVGSITALPNGTALAVLGGSAQIYDPATNGWTDTYAPLSASAVVNVDDAPLLPCRSRSGRVLVAGDRTDYEAGAQLYPGVASLYGVTPPTGAVAGGSTVRVTGVALAAGPASIKVRFGDTDGLNPVAAPDGTAIDVTAPPRAAGTVDVSVTIDGLPVEVCGPHAFSYVAPPPPSSCPGPACPVVTDPSLDVTSVRPASGPVAGGTPAVVSGHGFTSVSDILFGDADVTAPCPRSGTAGGAGCFSVRSETSIDVVSPAHPAGPVHVRVRTTRKVSPESPADVFTFVPAGSPPAADPSPVRPGAPPATQAETPANPTLPGPGAGPVTAGAPAPSSAPSPGNALSPGNAVSPGNALSPGNAVSPGSAGAPSPAGTVSHASTPGAAAGHVAAPSAPAVLAPGGATQVGPASSPASNPVVDRVRDPASDAAPSYKMVAHRHHGGPSSGAFPAAAALAGAAACAERRRRRAVPVCPARAYAG